MTEPIPSLEPDVPGRDGRAGVLLRAPYRKGLVVELKETLPRPLRYWDEGVGAWWIDAREEARAAEVVLRHFAALARLGDPGDEPTMLRRGETVSARAQRPYSTGSTAGG